MKSAYHSLFFFFCFFKFGFQCCWLNINISGCRLSHSILLSLSGSKISSDANGSGVNRVLFSLLPILDQFYFIYTNVQKYGVGKIF